MPWRGLFAGCSSTQAGRGAGRDPHARAHRRGGAAKGGAAGGTGTPQSSVATVDLSKSGGRRQCRGAGTAHRLLRLRQLRRQGRVPPDARRRTPRRWRPTAASAWSLEGHTDERGGREYNLALGQKRAEAVLKSLVLLGVLRQPARGGELRRRAPGAGRQRRGGLGQEPPRRTAGSMKCALPCCRPAAAPSRRGCFVSRPAAHKRSSSPTTTRARPFSTCARA